MNSLVIPVYKNEANLDRLLAELVKLASSVAGEFEVVFVVDGSPDRCLQILRERLPSLPLRTQLLSRRIWRQRSGLPSTTKTTSNSPGTLPASFTSSASRRSRFASFL